MTGAIAMLTVFFLWGTTTGVGTAIGLSFYIFLGIVNVFLIAQFWSYANDIYTEKQGKRLFAVIAIGQSLGAVLGPKIASAGADYTFLLLAASGGIFIASLYFYVVINQRVSTTPLPFGDRKQNEEPLQKGGGFCIDLLRTISALYRPYDPLYQHRQYNRRVHSFECSATNGGK